MIVTQTNARNLSMSAVVILSGVILSGPVAVGLVEFAAPQPAWRDAATFVQHYSWLQSLPYVFGFLILGGFIPFMAALVGSGSDDQRTRELTALALTGVSAAMIFVNYVLQTAFIPQSLNGNREILEAVTMANPRSFAWGLEMYGYGILGVATIVAAPLFESSGRQRIIRLLFILNGVVSVFTAALVPIVPGWLLTTPGIIAGALWNLLVVVIMVLVIREFRFGHLSRNQQQNES
jgi:hypothetical protein